MIDNIEDNRDYTLPAEAYNSMEEDDFITDTGGSILGLLDQTVSHLEGLKRKYSNTTPAPAIPTGTSLVEQEQASEMNAARLETINSTLSMVNKQRNETHFGKLFNMFAGSESENLHKDSKKIITMPYGVVPDAGTISRNDTGAPLESTKIPSDLVTSITTNAQVVEAFNTSAAIKSGVKRADFTSDKEFAKAVMVDFNTKAKNKVDKSSFYPSNLKWKSFDKDQKLYIMDIAWNSGTGPDGGLYWKDTKASLQEAAKPIKDRNTTEMLRTLNNFKTTSGSTTIWDRGLLKRRAMAYNIIAKPEDKAADIVTTSWNNSAGVRIGTNYTVKRADGTVLRTIKHNDTSQVIGVKSVPDY
jgi:hypothetical protein